MGHFLLIINSDLSDLRWDFTVMFFVGGNTTMLIETTSTKKPSGQIFFLLIFKTRFFVSDP